MKIDRSKLPSFFKNFPEERLKELMEDEYDDARKFEKAMDKMLHTNKKKVRKQGKN